ncbi:metal-dependent transcriptional regulator [Trueperella bialowiezensis]|uniref:Manganese transport regulator n=1 Tax=Trueperella bialowiezensis TaxID=312285 RepID=A0A3S4V803_9ACTO|nr:metal-dependent transcriptional regulator [Trueperella bialowiezensis]VEI13984.1 Iron-dependent repressor IdeR [Trueperella bialowiezensis]
MDTRSGLAGLSDAHQDYLKALWDNDRYVGGRSSMGDLVARTGQKKSTVTEAVKRMAADGLVDYKPYAGVALTERGRALATHMVRRHRLLETLLVTVFGYELDEVHDDAEVMEHALTDRFVARMDKFLGFPTRDPHGDPIPSASGEVEPLSGRTLRQLEEGSHGVVEQVSDRDPDLLRELTAAGIVPGASVAVVERQGEQALVQVRGDGEPAPTKESPVALTAELQERVRMSPQ